MWSEIQILPFVPIKLNASVEQNDSFPCMWPWTQDRTEGMLKDSSGYATSNTQPDGQNRLPNKDPWKSLELGTENREVGI